MLTVLHLLFDALFWLSLIYSGYMGATYDPKLIHRYKKNSHAEVMKSIIQLEIELYGEAVYSLDWIKSLESKVVANKGYNFIQVNQCRLCNKKFEVQGRKNARLCMSCNRKVTKHDDKYGRGYNYYGY